METVLTWPELSAVPDFFLYYRADDISQASIQLQCFCWICNECIFTPWPGRLLKRCCTTIL